MAATPRFETIQVTVQGPVGRLLLNRPERLNALSLATMEELIEAAAWFDADESVRAVVVAGAGRAFCAGYDLMDQGLDPAAAVSNEERRRVAGLGGRMADAVEAMRAVTVAALHGHVVGGGVVLAAVCDLRVAGAGTQFSIPEVDLGIPLAWGGVPRLVREIGPARTKDLVLTCRRFDAAEALAMGLINRLVPTDSVLAEAVALAAAIAAKARRPVRRTKEHVNAVAAGRMPEHDEVSALLMALDDPEARAAMASYIARLAGQG